MMNLRSVLEQIPLLKGISEPVFGLLLDVAAWKVYRAGEWILWEGDEDSPVFFVVDGLVRVFRSSLSGREQTVHYIEAGGVFNLPAIFADDHRTPSSVKAEQESHLLLFSQKDFRLAIERSPQLAQAVMRELSNRLVYFSRLTYDLSLLSVRGRLARFLLQQHAHPMQPALRWTHEDIAASIGTVREVVSRTLRAFIRERWIKIERQRIVLLDIDALEAEVEHSGVAEQ